jgi:hypothetical protein
MTQEVKHVLIAEFEGWKKLPADPRRDWVHVWMHPEFGNADVRYIPYSTDLNLCARVEAKIAELGIFDKYCDIIAADYFNIPAVLIRLTAEARVDAMVALIQQMKGAKK